MTTIEKNNTRELKLYTYREATVCVLICTVVFLFQVVFQFAYSIPFGACHLQTPF